MVNLTGGYGPILEENNRYWQKPNPDRFVIFTEPWFGKFTELNYPKFQADQIARAKEVGAKGLKLTKALGLYLREQVTTGPLVKVDDRRLDLMWEAAGALKMPVAIHTSDPEAFFLPIDQSNERFEELNAHPVCHSTARIFRATASYTKRVIASSPDTREHSSSLYTSAMQKT